MPVSILLSSGADDLLDIILTSFNDAPGGAQEEFKEITAAIGLEYRFEDSFSIRTGYFSESQDKGSRIPTILDRRSKIFFLICKLKKKFNGI